MESALRIISIVQSRVDAFINDIFDICESSEDSPASKGLSDTIAREIAIFNAVQTVIRRRRNEHIRFSRLATDIIHSIFDIALDLDQIHDPNFFSKRLDDHWNRLQSMRLVSSAWNQFLLSSPRSWQVIDLASPAKAITLAVERSGSAPLCVYLRGSLASPMHLVPAARVQTLRADDSAAFPLLRRFLRDPMPALRTLEFTAAHRAIVDHPVESLGNLPSIRHLNAKWWEPPVDAAWLTGLKELVLWRNQNSRTELHQLLSACASLEHLEIYSMDEVIAGELSADIPPVTLSLLRNLCLRFKWSESLATLIRRLRAPQCLQRTISAEQAPHLGLHVEDYRRFMSLEDKGTRRYPKSAAVRAESSWFGTLLEYQAETCKVSLKAPSAEEVPAFHDLVQEFQNVLKEPPLTLTIGDRSEDTWLFFKSLGNQNVQTIVAYPQTQSPDTDDLLGAIGMQSTDLPSLDGPVTNTATDWPFKSLRCIFIHGTRVKLVEFTKKVEEYLHKGFKPLLEKIVFINCGFEGMKLAQAAERLAAIGIALQAIDGHRG